MKEPLNRSHETNTTTPDFQKKIDAITDRELTPENIDTYADDALQDLIDIIESLKASYDGSSMPEVLTPSGQEMFMMHQAGLNPDYIENALDHIANTADDIVRIKKIVEDLEFGETVITPPNAASLGFMNFEPGDGSFEQKRTISRLQTLLLILERNFNVDVNPDTADPSEFKIIRGRVRPDMVRRTPYSLIELPALNRIINICDEEGNRTFVFDREKLLHEGLTCDQLKDMSKEELDEILNGHSAIGRSVIYSNKFVENITSLINDITSPDEQSGLHSDRSAKLLDASRPPEGFMAISTLAKQLMMAAETLQKEIDALIQIRGDEFGDIIKWRSRAYYSPRQRAMIEERINEHNPRIPEGYKTAYQLAKFYGIDRKTLDKHVEALGEEFGEVREYRVTGGKGVGFSPKQQDMLDKSLGDVLAVPKIPADYHTASSLAKKLGVDPGTVANAMKALDDEGRLGELRTFRKAPGTVIGLDSEQQATVEAYLKNAGVFAEEAPLGYRTISGMVAHIRDSYGVSLQHSAIKKVINMLGEKLGDTQEYMFGPHSYTGYSPEQQDMVYGYVEANDMLVPPAPDDYRSMGMIAREIKAAYPTIRAAIENIRGELGKISRYKFGTVVTEGFSPEQTVAIIRQIEQGRLM